MISTTSLLCGFTRVSVLLLPLVTHNASSPAATASAPAAT
jgi:hypothetical protein